MKQLIFILLFPLCLAGQGYPNIILIVADDMGNGDISYNNALYSTPTIDSLATNGAYFTRNYVNAVCSPSRAALMTGRQSWRMGLGTHVIYYYSERHLPRDERALPEYLKEYGYTTGMVGKWHLGNAHPEYLPNTRGFDYVFGSSQGNTTYYTYTVRGGYDLFENGLRYEADSIYLTELFGQKAEEFIQQQTRCNDNPFFLYLPHLAPHVSNDGTIEVPADSLALAPGGYTTAQKKYWVMMKILDNEINRVWQAVIDAGIEDETIIIVTSDNGANTNYSGSNSPFSGNKATLNEGAIRTPLIWYHANTVSPITIDSVVGFVDFVPTLIEGVLADSSPPYEADSLDGVNFYPLLSGGTIDADRYIVPTIVPNRQWVIIQDSFKLVNNRTISVQDTTAAADDIELFNIISDPTESTDLSGSRTDKVTELTNLITPLLGEVDVSQSIYLSKPAGFGDDPALWSSPELFYDPSYFFYR